MITETKLIKLANGLNLECEISEVGSPVWIVASHGLGEHKGRQKFLYEQFSQYFNIITYDLRGHGKSEGKPAYIDSFTDYVEDLEEVINYLISEYDMKRYILFGHSMGALITASYMQKKAKYNLYPEKVFMSAPPVAAPGILGAIFDIAPLGLTNTFANIKTSVALGGMLDIKKLSHDKRVYEAYVKDTLTHLKIHSRLLFQIVNHARDVFSRPLRIECESYVAIGMGDVLVNPKALVKYFSEVEKNVKLFKQDEAYHEMHNEIEKYRAPYLAFLKESLMSSIYS